LSLSFDLVWCVVRCLHLDAVSLIVFRLGMEHVPTTRFCMNASTLRLFSSLRSSILIGRAGNGTGVASIGSGVSSGVRGMIISCCKDAVNVLLT